MDIGTIPSTEVKDSITDNKLTYVILDSRNTVK